MTKRNYIIAGNWKMNGDKASIEKLLTGIKTGIKEFDSDHLTWLVFPPYPYLGQVENLLKETPIKYGAQNLCTEAKGAFTGEVSFNMLKDFGCSHVLVGHSERRSIYKEDDETVAKKFAIALEAGLTPILCIGETLAQREANQAEETVKRQIDAVLNLENGIELLAKAIIAYEPIWAIGTGVTATPEEAQNMHSVIRNYLSKFNANIAENLNILYGGSLKPGNAKELLAMPDINGGLIGGASLKAEDFVAIGKATI